MARTYKDRKYELQPYFTPFRTSFYLDDRLCDLPKKSRKVCNKYFWYKRSPTWWNRMQMHKPKRRQCRIWEQQTKHLTSFDLADCPDFGRKPHVYFM